MTLGLLVVSHAPGNEQIIMIMIKKKKKPASKESNISPASLAALSIKGCFACVYLSDKINGIGPST